MFYKFCYWLILGTLITQARGDCDACVAGRCHSRRPLMQGFEVTDQLAVDRTNNIVYAQLEHNRNVAIYLEEPKIQLIQIMKTTGMTVDQNTQILYAGDSDFIYGFKIDETGSYEADVSFILDDHTPARLHYADVLYTINTDGSCAYFRSATGEPAGQDNLQDYEVSDMVKVINATSWVFVADNNLYKFVWWYGEYASHLISENKNLLSTDKYGDVYVRDATEKVIYKLDRLTEELEVYASYKTGVVEDFVFDKDNNMIFRDVDDTIARWMPEQELCHKHFEAPSHIVNDFAPGDDFLVQLLRNPGYFYNTVPPTDYDY